MQAVILAAGDRTRGGDQVHVHTRKCGMCDGKCWRPYPDTSDGYWDWRIAHPDSLEYPTYECDSCGGMGKVVDTGWTCHGCGQRFFQDTPRAGIAYYGGTPDAVLDSSVWMCRSCADNTLVTNANAILADGLSVDCTLGLCGASAPQLMRYGQPVQLPNPRHQCKQ